MSVWLLILTKSNATIIYLIFLISVFFNIFFQICPFIFYLLTFIWFVSRVILFCKFIFKVHTQSCYHFFFITMDTSLSRVMKLQILEINTIKSHTFGLLLHLLNLYQQICIILNLSKIFNLEGRGALNQAFTYN